MDPVPMAIGMAAAGAGRGRVHAPVAQCVRCGRACFGAKAMATGPGGARIPMPRDTLACTGRSRGETGEGQASLYVCLDPAGTGGRPFAHGGRKTVAVQQQYKVNSSR